MKRIYTIQDYDEVVEALVSALKEQNLVLSKSQADGRVDSILNEKEVIKVALSIYNKIKIFNDWNLILEEQPKERYWYDIIIRNDDNSFYCPINIKISDFNNSSADNISSKSGLFFALTGEVKETCPNNFRSYFNLLSTNIKETNTDYYFIVLNKTKKNDIIFNSLKRLKSLTPNGNNLPFQCKWSENRERKNRTFEEYKDFLLVSLYESVRKRAKIIDEFLEAFEEYKKMLNDTK